MKQNNFQALALFGLAAVALLTTLNRKTMNSQSQLESQRYLLADGREALTAATMRLGMEEIRELLPATLRHLETMEQKLSRIEKIQETATRTTASFTVKLRDSLMRRQGADTLLAGHRIRDETVKLPLPEVLLPSPAPLFDSVRVFSYRTDYLRLEGVLRGDSQQIRLELSDTLLQVVRRGARPRPWLWIFSRRPLEQTLRLSNPDARIRYSRTIEIQK